MAPIEKKRKTGPTNDSFARPRKPDDKDGRPSKRPRAEEQRDERPKANTAATKLSKVREEDAAFPRGGASVLTPLEHKQIQIEATQDVLFERKSMETMKIQVKELQKIRRSGGRESQTHSLQKPRTRL
jgi:rRNA biogenesis protein RRP5